MNIFLSEHYWNETLPALRCILQQSINTVQLGVVSIIANGYENCKTGCALNQCESPHPLSSKMAFVTVRVHMLVELALFTLFSYPV
jgi:hypothetical protein